MRTALSMILAATLAAAGFTAFGSSADPLIQGTLSTMRQTEVADIDADPKAHTVGEFMHDYPRASSVRMRNFPTKSVVELTVNTDDGKRIKVTQDATEARNLEVGGKVVIDTVDGKQKVVAAQ
ncbi:MAG: hypothetical protein JO002_17060 [Burkholderiaceae bacterium]|nr:hypothetical protein [Burkholderiaceae bacterium]